ncbi:MAG: HAMP domain-containing histidine kinase [Pseudomonadaceae bacterium]|nr:HAMP domain-containing histidine kinase [Pseudomonadaceae bacterium]
MQYYVRNYLLAVDDNLGNSTTLLALVAAALHVIYYFLNTASGYPDPIYVRIPVLAALLTAAIFPVYRRILDRSYVGLASLIALLATCPTFFTYIVFYEANVVASSAGDQIVRQLELLVATGISIFLLPSSVVSIALIFVSCICGTVTFLMLENPSNIVNPLSNYPSSAAWIMGMVLLAHLAHRKAEETKKSAQTARALTGSLAHEIRTPLTSIHSYAKGIEVHLETLRDVETNGDSERDRKIHQLSDAAKAIQKETEYSSLFIDMALTATRSADELTGRESISLAKTIREAIHRFPFNNSHEEEMVETQLDDDFSVYANHQILTHAVFNLLKNAVFFAQVGGSGRVVISLNSDSRAMLFRDNGPGIPEKNRRLIYEPFFTTREAQTGAGLGLWFSRRAFEDMGGRLSHQNIGTSGCEFRASFPADLNAKIGWDSSA